MNEKVVDFSAWCDEKLSEMLVINAVGNDTCGLDSLNQRLKLTKVVQCVACTL